MMLHHKVPTQGGLCQPRRPEARRAPYKKRGKMEISGITPTLVQCLRQALIDARQVD